MATLHTAEEHTLLRHAHPAAITDAPNPQIRMQDTPRNMRFSINFFTSIGLGGLTDDMREHLKVWGRAAAAATIAAAAAAALFTKRWWSDRCSAKCILTCFLSATCRTCPS